MLFDLKHITLGYDQPLITDFSAQISAKEMVLILGRNGVGKSTLLNAIKGNMQVLSGEIEYKHQPLNSYTSSTLSREIAIVNTTRPLLTGWTGEDVLKSTANAVNQINANEIIEETLALCKIESIVKRQVDELSDGEFQKVMVARAICQQTPVIVLDEPTSFLDVVYRDHVLQIFKELRDKFNTTLILSSHNFAPLLETADQVWVLTQGKVDILRSKLEYSNIISRLKQ